MALLALATVLASGCGRGDEDGGVGGGGGAAAAPGITDTSIKLGGSYPFSGPASAYASIASGAKARFAAENAKGGIDGRKIEFITLDDGYEPQRAVTNAPPAGRAGQGLRAVQHARHAEQPGDLGLRQPAEGPARVRRHGRVGLGRGHRTHPYTTGWQPDYVSEAKAYAEFLKAEKPKAKVAVLYQNDGFGKDLLGGFEKAIEGSDVQSSRARATR